MAEEEEVIETEVTGNQWHSYLMPLDVRSTDGREFDAAGAGYRELPLPLMYQPENHPGHDSAFVIGTIRTIEFRDGLAYGEGTYVENPDEEVAKAIEHIEKQEVRWVSVDFEPLEWEEYLEVDGERVDLDDADEDDWINGRWITLFNKFNIMGATVLTFPAFPQAVIAPIDQELEKVSEEAVTAAVAMGAITACGVDGAPPVEWFQNPELSELTPLTITRDGRIFGHLAPWDMPHIGFPDRQLYAPKSATNYAHFHLGSVLTKDGSEVAVGRITVGGGHAERGLSAADTVKHYDEAGYAAADIVCGEDDHGIWFSGALKSDVTEDQVRRLRANGVSGDWRRVGGNLELVALASVPVPGFPVLRGSQRDGKELALVASGMVAHKRDVRGQIAALNRVVQPLVKAQAAELAKRVRA